MRTWRRELSGASIHQLRIPEGENRWSLGQVYIHLIADTEYYFQQVDICLKTNRNSLGKKTPSGFLLFRNNSFPNQRLKGPPDATDPSQPASVSEINEGLDLIHSGFMNRMEIARRTSFKGKTLHPGFGWLSAGEWCQFVVMHMRHHLRQMRRLKKVIKASAQATEIQRRG